MAKALTEKEYLLIKDALIEGNLTDRQIADKTGRGTETVRRIKGTETFEEYTADQKARMSKWRQSEKRKRVATEVAAVAEVPADNQEPALIRELRQQQAAIYQQFEDVIKTLEGLYK